MFSDFAGPNPWNLQSWSVVFHTVLENQRGIHDCETPRVSFFLLAGFYKNPNILLLRLHSRSDSSRNHRARDRSSVSFVCSKFQLSIYDPFSFPIFTMFMLWFLCVCLFSFSMVPEILDWFNIMWIDALKSSVWRGVIWHFFITRWNLISPFCVEREFLTFFFVILLKDMIFHSWFMLEQLHMNLGYSSPNQSVDISER